MSGTPVLLVAARGHACALALADVVETFRPLPVRPLAELPGFALGLAVIRGAATPVVDLGVLLGARGPAAPTRFVTVRAGGRVVALAVEAVAGLAELEPASLERLPEAHAARGARTSLIASVGTVSGELLVLLRAGNLLDADLWARAA